MRSFVGIPLPAVVSHAIEPLQNGLPIARAVPVEFLHITLAFLDDQTKAALLALTEDLDQIDMPRFPIRLKGITLLGRKEARAIAVAADGGDALKRLQSRIAYLARENGMDLPHRRFRPHVTILRLPRQIDSISKDRIQHWITANGQFEEVVFEAHEFALFRSHLTASGAVYEVLDSFPLRARI